MTTSHRKYGLFATVAVAAMLAVVVDAIGVVEQTILTLFWVATIAANLYVAVYAFRPWRSTRQGEALMLKGWGNVILLNLSMAFLLFGYDYWGRDFFRVLGMTAFTTGICYLLFTLLTSPGAREYPPFRWRRRKSRP